MKIDKLPLQAPPTHGTHKPAAPAPSPAPAHDGESESPSVVVQVSDARGGKSAQSPAHAARAMMAEYQSLGASFGGKNFGQLVSQIARGLDTDSLFQTARSDAPETDAAAASEAGGSDDAAVENGEAGPAGEVAPELSLAEALLEATAEGAEETSDASLLETLLEESDTTA
ncbi:MAG: hypothetical protein QF893_11035 [Alphaproteobacteria bacterium]|jgi:hypothetical protein|nr:hypothetical protein [Alphaproteobacteria bacterium]